ncbi:MAG: hypothetical protein AVDCRST_MAG77-5877, partial [uncultured Chloroflexi bacterium]
AIHPHEQEGADLHPPRQGSHAAEQPQAAHPLLRPRGEAGRGAGRRPGGLPHRGERAHRPALPQEGL